MLNNNPEPEPRPVDIVLPEADRVNSIKRGYCVQPPFGCGKPLPLVNPFRDDISVKEYYISGLCQECQDTVFADGPEEDAPENLGELP